jgi:hypothetical protein
MFRNLRLVQKFGKPKLAGKFGVRGHVRALKAATRRRSPCGCVTTILLLRGKNDYIPAVQQLKKIFLLAITMAMTLAVLFLGVFLGLILAHWKGPGLRVENTGTVIQQVQTLSDLVTVKYMMQKVEFVDSPPGSALGQFVQGDNKVMLLAQGVVKAGIDLKKITPGDVAISSKALTITLPKPEITDAYLDDTQTKVVERTTGFLRSLDKDLEQTTRQYAVDDIRRAAQESGILNDANERARTELRTFFRQAGFEPVEFR